jgi:hypothetical protein
MDITVTKISDNEIIEVFSNLQLLQNTLVISVADPGCLSRIPDPNFSIPDSGSKRFRIPDRDPHPRIQVFLTQKNYF